MGSGHTLDANTLVLWRLDDTGAPLVDAAGNANLASVQNTSGDMISGPAASLPGGGKKLDQYHAYRQGSNAPSSQVTAVGGEVTVEAWVCLQSATATGQRAIVDLLDTGYLHNALRTAIETDGSLQFFWNVAGNVNGGVNSTTYKLTVANEWLHLAFRRYQESDSSWSADFWVNGSMVEKRTNVAAPVALSSTDCQWSIGVHPAAGAAGQWATVNGVSGFIDDVRVSKVKRSDAEILASYNNGVGIAATPSAPVITYSPADGTPVLPSAQLQVTATSNDPSGLALVTIGIYYPSGAYEVVYDGSRFAAGMSGTKSNVTNGLQFLFSRVGGWPETPALVVTATDHFGQVTRI